MMTLKPWLFSLLLVCMPAWSLEPRSAHTFGLAPGETPPAVALEDLHWLVGSWTGEMLGSTFEEVWSPPSAGSMMGMFKMHAGFGVGFYEFQLIKAEQDNIVWKVKHFTSGMIGWEMPDEYAQFRFVGIDENAVHFEGLSIYRQDANNLEAWIMLNNDGVITEEKIVYRRQ